MAEEKDLKERADELKEKGMTLEKGEEVKEEDLDALQR